MTSASLSTTESADVNLKIVWSLARWIEDTHGTKALQSAAKAAGLPLESIDNSTMWVPLERVEAFLAEGRALVEDDEAFVKACGHRFAESYGPVRYMVWALSERQFFEGAVKMSRLMTRVSHFETVRSERNEFEVRYFSQRKESRLMCLSRHAAWAYGPMMWGMPAAEFTEKACIAKGDDYCEYHLKWFERRRLMPILAGLALGAVAAAVLDVGHGVLHPLLQRLLTPSATFPMLGASLGYIYELRRAQKTNLQMSSELNAVLRELGQNEAEARSEIVALNQRQRDWVRMMEQQVAERTTTLERVVEGLDQLQQKRVTTLRGFSHDLRNPLFVVRGNTQFLRERIVDGEEAEALRDMDAASLQIEAMLAMLMEVASQDSGFVRLTPKLLPVPPMVETFRRRLKALVHGRDIKVSVFKSREAPAEITVDPLVYDRVIDNLLTNAAKYTQRGSILLEISGTPPPVSTPDHAGYLTLKLSDTGQGIDPDDIRRIFHPRGELEPSGRLDSYGVGLSSVVRLLDQIGGSIDVMSKPNVGTTFWVHLPIGGAPAKKAPPQDDTIDSMIMRVVKVRKAAGT